MPLVLASGSPRRAALLREAAIPFEVGPSPDVDEAPPRDDAGHLPPPADVVLILARRKSEAACAQHAPSWVLTADTLVFLDGEPLGKPADGAEAAAMLGALSDRWHEVWTGMVLSRPGADSLEAAVRTRVKFRELGRDEIAAYAASGEPLDKAGGYGIQAGAAGFVAELDGPLDNVIGLPIARLKALLQEA
jgi:septum formation protein